MRHSLLLAICVLAGCGGATVHHFADNDASVAADIAFGFSDDAMMMKACKPGDPPVYLGSFVGGKVDDSRRVYVGAVGARIEAASRSTRILLGPDEPG